MALNCAISNEKSGRKSLFTEADLRKYIKEVLKYPNLSAKEELETARLAHEGSKEAKNKLIKANLKLVIFTAEKFIHKSGVPMIDLIQEGNIGLMYAADRFNWKFGYRFAAYAVWSIKQAMFKAVSEQSHSVRIPVYIQETLSRYSKIKAEIEQKTSRPADIEEIAERMKINSGRINNYLNADKKTLSLEADYTMLNGSEVRLIDIIEDKKSEISSRLEKESLKRAVTELVKGLKEREQRVISMRFGLNGAEKQTLEAIGRMYGVTKECIRQTESRALAKLRSSSRTGMLYADYLN